MSLVVLLCLPFALLISLAFWWEFFNPVSNPFPLPAQKGGV